MYDDGYSINSLISLKEVLTKSTNSSYIPFKLGYKSGLRLIKREQYLTKYQKKVQQNVRTGIGIFPRLN